jgi:hypothetical protein
MDGNGLAARVERSLPYPPLSQMDSRQRGELRAGGGRGSRVRGPARKVASCLARSGVALDRRTPGRWSGSKRGSAERPWTAATKHCAAGRPAGLGCLLRRGPRWLAVALQLRSQARRPRPRDPGSSATRAEPARVLQLASSAGAALERASAELRGPCSLGRGRLRRPRSPPEKRF